jgi:hypothetical protein
MMSDMEPQDLRAFVAELEELQESAARQWVELARRQYNYPAGPLPRRSFRGVVRERVHGARTRVARLIAPWLDEGW